MDILLGSRMVNNLIMVLIGFIYFIKLTDIIHLYVYFLGLFLLLTIILNESDLDSMFIDFSLFFYLG